MRRLKTIGLHVEAWVLGAVMVTSLVAFVASIIR
jgi:hypothetical protein